jgi:hypothetical protein
VDIVNCTGRHFSALCRDVYMLTQGIDPVSGPRGGRQWEQRIATMLAQRGFPVGSIPGGIQVHGVLPASGLRHQTDAAIECHDAYVIGEWKSCVGAVPKNEVLRFKAVTDDLYEAMAELRPRRPVLRLFGVAGDASRELRWYAARHSITLVEKSRWPAPVLASHDICWPPGDGPSRIDLARLAWLSRPLQAVYPRLPDGSLRLPRRPPDPTIEGLLALHDRWSDRLWELLDAHPGQFERLAHRFTA